MPLFVGASESYDTDAWEAYNLKKENAKLRELVWRLLEIERIGATSSEWHEVHEAARELGVEVDG